MTLCSCAMMPPAMLLPHAQGLGAALLGRRAGLPPRAEAARSQAVLGHGWSAGGVAGRIVCLQARVTPRQILRRTLGGGSYTHCARIPRLCGLWGPLPAAWQRDGGARYLPVCLGYPDSKAKSAGVCQRVYVNGFGRSQCTLSDETEEGKCRVSFAAASSLRVAVRPMGPVHSRVHTVYTQLL